MLLAAIRVFFIIYLLIFVLVSEYFLLHMCYSRCAYLTKVVIDFF